MKRTILRASLIAMLGVAVYGNDFMNVMASEEVSADVIFVPGAGNTQAVQRIVAKMQNHIRSGYYDGAVELMSNYVYAKGDSLEALFPSVLKDLGLGNPLDDDAKHRVVKLLRTLCELSLETRFRYIAEDELLRIATDDLDAYQAMANEVGYEFTQQRALAAALAGSVKVFKFMVMNLSPIYDSDLFNAALVGGNPELVRLCTHGGADENWSFNCFRGEGFIKDNLFLWLINQGKKIDKEVADRFLLTTSAGGRLNFVKYLVEKCKADVETKGGWNEGTPIYYASDSGNLDVVKYLVEKGANVEAKDEGGKTPLIIASRLGNLELVKYLHEQCHADVEAKDEDGRTPLIIATEWRYLNMVKYLVEECHAEITDETINRGDYELRKYLKRKKAEQDAQK